MAERRLRDGFQFIAISSEAGFMMAKAREVAQTLNLGKGVSAAKY